jgi:hypothetical protein
MSTSMLMNTCQVCGAEESLDTLIARMTEDDQVRRLIGSVLLTSFPLGGQVVRYLRLHKPPKQKLRMDKLAKLLGELVPDIQRTAIERNGRTWVVGPDAWKAALQAVFDAHEKGTLSVPLEGNGYLYATLMRMADRHEGLQEREYEASRKHGPVTSTVAVKTGPVPVADAFGAAMGGRDPVLVKLDQDKQNAAPMPEAVRKRIAELKGKPASNDLPTEKGTQDE